MKRPKNLADTCFYRGPPIAPIFRKNLRISADKKNYAANIASRGGRGSGRGNNNRGGRGGGGRSRGSNNNRCRDNYNRSGFKTTMEATEAKAR
jgi:hypothetical protein